MGTEAPAGGGNDRDSMGACWQKRGGLPGWPELAWDAARRQTTWKEAGSCSSA